MIAKIIFSTIGILLNLKFMLLQASPQYRIIIANKIQMYRNLGIPVVIIKGPRPIQQVKDDVRIIAAAAGEKERGEKRKKGEEKKGEKRKKGDKEKGEKRKGKRKWIR